MDYQQSQSQQKSKLQDQTAASVSMEKMVESIAKSSEAGGGMGGNFIAEISSALNEYSSGKSSIVSLDAQIASISMPEIKERKGLAKFFYKLFGKDKKDEAAIQAYKKGERTPEGLRTWLENEGLHKMEPDNVSGNSEMSAKERKAS